MKIAIITNDMHPDVFTNSRLLLDAAEGFAERGHQVVFYTSAPLSNDPEPELVEGISFKRHWSPHFNRHGTIGRVANSIVVGMLIFLRLLFTSKPDVMLVDTTGAFNGPCAWLISRVRGHKYVYLATELFPDLAIALGVLREGGIAARVWDISNKRVYGRASVVIVIGSELRNKVARHIRGGIDAPKLRVVHNWEDPNAMVPVPKSENWWLKEQGLEDKFIVLYSGNMGRSHDLGTLVEAADILREQDRFMVVLIGEGVSKPKLVSEVESRNLTNVRFLPYQPVEVLPYSLTSGDLSVVTLSADAEEMTIPSKLYTSMAAGQAILALIGPQTDVGKMTLENEIGIQASQTDATALAGELARLLDDPEEVERMKTNSRKLFECNFTREQAISAYEEILEEVANS